jgi:hypothetical protein
MHGEVTFSVLFYLFPGTFRMFGESSCIQKLQIYIIFLLFSRKKQGSAKHFHIRTIIETQRSLMSVSHVTFHNVCFHILVFRIFAPRLRDKMMNREGS